MNKVNRVMQELNYVSGVITNRGRLEETDLQRVLTAFREECDVDAVYILRINVDGRGFLFTGADSAEGTVNPCGTECKLTDEEYEMFRAFYRDESISDRVFAKVCPDAKSMLHFGACRNGQLDGCVGMIDRKHENHVWEYEERELLARLGRLLHPTLIAGRLDDALQLERNRAWKELKEEKVQLKKIHDIIHSGIWSMEINENNRIASVNWSDEFRHLIGYTDERDFPNTMDAWKRIIHPDEQRLVMDTIENTLTDFEVDDPTYDIDFRMRTKNGEWHWYHLAGRILRVIGYMGEIFGTVIDTTESRHLEETSRILRTLSTDFTGLYTANLDTMQSTVISLSEMNERDTGEEIRRRQNLEEVWDVFVKTYVHPDDRAEMLHELEVPVIREKLSHARRYKTLFRRNFDGEYLYSEMTVAKADMAEERPVNIVIGFSLVDEHYRAMKEALRTADAFQKAAFATSLGYFLADLTENRLTSDIFRIEDGKVVDEVGLFEDMSSRTYQDVMDSFADRCIQDNTDEYREAMNRDILLQKAENGMMQTDVVCWVKIPNLSRKCLKHSVYLSVDEKTRHVMATVIMYDVSEQELAERVNKRRIDSIMHLADDFVAIYDVNPETGQYRIYSGNDDFAQEINQLSGDGDFFEEVRQNIETLVYSDDRDEVLRLFTREQLEYQLEMKTQVIYDFRMMLNGEPKWHQLKLVRFTDDERDHFLVGIFDINEKRLEEHKHEQAMEKALHMAQSANLAKTAFLNNMSHDIRTPMNAIVGYTELAKNEAGNSEKIEEYLKKIGLSSDHLLSLINDMLDMSRIESGKLSLNETPERLSEIINAVQAILQQSATEKNLKLDIDCSEVTDDHIICDRLRMSQILLNIMSNAVKYTPNGGQVSLKVTESETQNPDSARYRISIKDNGIGMSEEFLKIVMEPFTRVSNSTVSGIQGTGLGMAITKNLVELMGGTLTMKSTESVGTEVTADVEFRLGSPVEEQETVNRKRKDLSGLGCGRTVMLVEDNEMNREIAETMLQRWGFSVISAEDGTIALKLLTEEGATVPDMILMDVQMPVMNGYDATIKIRELPDPVLRSIPIVAMTANAFEEDRREALRVGMNGYISKPINMEKMQMLLDDVISGKTLTE